MQRLFTKNATGVAPDGRLYAGDINALEDAAAAQTDLAQTIALAVLEIGQVDLQLLRYGALEARVTGALRTDGILRGLGGLYAGAFTTTQRDAITSPPYGLIILNTTNNRPEWNIGTSGSPSWVPFGGSVSRGTHAARPAAVTANTNSFYFETDINGGTLFYSDGSVWTKIAAGLTEAPTIADASLSAAKINGTAVVTADARLSDQRVPTANSVDDTKIANGALAPAKINGTAVVTADARLSDTRVPTLGHDPATYGAAFPAVNLFNGYVFRLIVSSSIGGSVAWDFIYRVDLDATYPWHFVGGSPICGTVPDITITHPTTVVYANLAAIPYAGMYDADVSSRTGSGNAAPGQECWTGPNTRYIARDNATILSAAFVDAHMNQYSLSAYPGFTFSDRVTMATVGTIQTRADQPGSVGGGASVHSSVGIYGGRYHIFPVKLKGS